MSEEQNILNEIHEAFLGDDCSVTDFIASIQNLTPRQKAAIDKVHEYVEKSIAISR